MIKTQKQEKFQELTLKCECKSVLCDPLSWMNEMNEVVNL
jgi:hypothetical protein